MYTSKCISIQFNAKKINNSRKRDTLVINTAEGKANA